MKIRYLPSTDRFAIALVGILTPWAIAGCSTPATSDNPVVPSAIASTPANPNQIRQTTVLSGLEHPWGMVWLPDGSQLITERPGRLRIVRQGVLDPTAIAGVPDVLAEGQGGLLDIALHPNFAQNRWIYLTYAHGTPAANRTRLARARLDGMTLRDVEVIFEVTQSKSGTQHFGSRLLWLPDGTMLLAIGDGGNPPVSLDGALIRQQAQNRRSRLGKVVRLKDDGSIPPDNPFVGQADTDPAIWSYGHRNIQGLAFDPIAQRIWSTEHGSKGGDELNLLQAGKNYGWPLVSHSREYFGPEITLERSRPGMVDPKVVWTPALAPSGLVVYTGDRVPAWRGNLFAGGLASQRVQRIVVDAQGAVVSQQEIPIGQRVRDVRQGPDGWIYLLTDEADGKLMRLEPGDG